MVPGTVAPTNITHNFRAALFVYDATDSCDEDEDTLEAIVKEEVHSYFRHVKRNGHVIQDLVNNSTFDVLMWWKENHVNFPQVANLVKYILSTPATSVNCERAFSSVNDIVTTKQSLLSNRSIEMIKCMKSNFSDIPETTEVTNNDLKNIAPDYYYLNYFCASLQMDRFLARIVVFTANFSKSLQ